MYGESINMVLPVLPLFEDWISGYWLFPAAGSDCDVLPATKQNADIGDVPPALQ